MPSASRLEQHPLDRPRPSSSVSLPAAGEPPAAMRCAYAAGCFTFHQRTPPTWLRAPGPMPHQSSPVQ